MIGFLAQIPTEVQQSLERETGLSYQDVDVRVERLQLEARIAGPASHASYGLRRVVGRLRGRRTGSRLRVIGATIGHTIYIDPEYADWGTAAGQALLAHERWHLEQKRTIPNFDALYAEEEAQTHPDRPWENRYEYDAYLRECKVFAALMRRGMPQGGWIPLGVQIGLCTL